MNGLWSGISANRAEIAVHDSDAPKDLFNAERFLPIYMMTLGGAFLWQLSPQSNLITAFVFGIIGSIGFAVFGRDIPAHVIDKKTSVSSAFKA